MNTVKRGIIPFKVLVPLIIMVVLVVIVLAIVLGAKPDILQDLAKAIGLVRI